MRPYLFLFLLIVLAACGRESAPTPTPPAPLHVLPQGNGPVDDTILAFHRQYRSYVLYRFSQSDYAWNYTSTKTDTAFNAHPAYIDTALQFFKKQLMVYYPEAFLQQTMPFRILLAAYIGSGQARSATGFASTNGMLAIGWADSTILNKTPAEAKAMRSQLHRCYWERAYRTLSVDIPPAFAALAPAVGYANLYGSYERLTEGVVSTAPALNLAEDFLSYIELITGKTTAELEAGLFQPNIDQKGLIRKKYNAIVDYYRLEQGIDLQAIGQLP